MTAAKAGDGPAGPGLTLYHAEHSTCSQKVRLVLAEKRLDWNSRLVDLATNEHLTPGYLAINPNGVVPTLVHDGEVVTDSSVICEYLDEVFAAPPLMPGDPLARARVRAWMRFFEEVPTAAVRVPSFNMAFLPRYAGLDDAGFRATQSDIRPIRKHFYRRMGRHGFGRDEVDAALEAMARTFARMETALADQPWICGESLTLADLIMAPLMDRMDDLGLSHLWTADYPAVTRWQAALGARPSWAATFHPRARLSAFLPIGPLYTRD